MATAAVVEGVFEDIIRTDGIEKRVRQLSGQIFVCKGCCCGNVEKGHPALPLEEFKSQWKSRGLRLKVHLSISGCLGPCPLRNVVLLVFGGKSLWLQSINDPADVDLIYDYVEGLLAEGQFQPPSKPLSDKVFPRYLDSQESKDSCQNT